MVVREGLSEDETLKEKTMAERTANAEALKLRLFWE